MTTTVQAEVEVRKTMRGAESVARKLNEANSFAGVRFHAEPCSIRKSAFVVIRTDGAAMREPDSLTRPDRVERFGGERDVASMRGKKSRSRERDTFNRRVFA